MSREGKKKRKKRKKEAAARRRSAREAEKEAGKGGKGGEERREGEREKRRRRKKVADLEREVREIFARVAFTVTSIDTADIYYRKGEEDGGGWGTRCTFVARRIEKVLSPGYGRRGVDTGWATRTTVARPRLETRTHCKAFLMTEEILSYTHPFRTDASVAEGAFCLRGCVPKDRESVGAARSGVGEHH